MKKKKTETPAAVPRLQDMSLSDISRMNVEAIETGNAGKLLDVMRASIEPEAPAIPGPRYAVYLPVLRVDDERAIGMSIALVYGGDGPEVSLELPTGKRYAVSLQQIHSALQAMQTAMYSAPPRPVVFPPR
jgi:hypothetical protein